MPDIVMPRLSDSMEEGTILRWLKAPGDRVERGEELVEIETDKANMTYESDTAGVLEIVAQEGATLPIGELIARVGDGTGGSAAGGDSAAAGDSAEGQAARRAGPVGGEDASGGQAAEAVSPPPPARSASAEPTTPPAASQPAPTSAPEPTEAGGLGLAGGERIKVSPVARRLARERGVDLTTLRGSGPGGRIVKADIEAAAGAAPNAGGTPEALAAPPGRADESGAGTMAPAGVPAEGAPPPAPVPSAPSAPAAPGGGKGETTTVELTRTQQTIARRMAEAKATVPDFQVTTEVDMAAAVALRARLKELATEERPAPSLNDLVVKAAALALRDFPRANGAYRDGRWEQYERINIGVAVAGEGTLIVPTVFDADRKSLGEIARETRALAARVRDGSITPPELSAGTFTVSNLGMFGVTEFTAIINGGQAAILAVGALRDVPVVADGEIIAGRRMSLTLVCDHRILYGADGAQLLGRIRALLESPLGFAL